MATKQADVVIVGLGASGALLARRLTEATEGQLKSLLDKYAQAFA